MGDSILVGPCGVVLGQGGLEEPLGVVGSLRLVHCAQQYKGNLRIVQDDDQVDKQ